ncbi:MAG: hypothetical protein AAF685_08815 [Cyanobacteria bacterium P01_C01_bin.89]
MDLLSVELPKLETCDEAVVLALRGCVLALWLLRRRRFPVAAGRSRCELEVERRDGEDSAVD